jgi:hypothetical protein
MPTFKALEEKSKRTDQAAAALLEQERRAREQKTARLRTLRLAKETVEKARGPAR